MQILMQEHGESVYRNDLAPHRCRTGLSGCYGVTGTFWGHAFGGIRQKAAPVAADRGRHVH